MSSSSSTVKKIRLEQKPLPVSSEEELTLVTLREQNKKLSNNYSHRIKIEADLKKKVEQLEETLRLCEDKEPEHQLTIVNENLRNRIDDLEFELNKTRLNERRLANDLDHLNIEYSEARKKFSQSNPDSIRNHTSVIIHHSSSSDQNNQQISVNLLGTSGGDSSTNAHVNSAPDDSLMLNHVKNIQDLETKLSDQTELAEHRLKELESINDQYKDALLTIDRLKAESKCLPKEMIIDSPEYKTLQSHFSVLYNEATQLKTQLMESRAMIVEMKNGHARQIDRMAIEEQRIQKELRTTIIELERNLAQARSQLAIFRLDYDNIVKANEQTVKLDTELKKSVNSYKTQVQQKNNELARLKRMLGESKGPIFSNVEQALMQDLDVTGQAYEDMQEQNHRLLQQLEEKDDANFKLMSEHLKTTAFQKHLNEEKAELQKKLNICNDLVNTAGREAKLQNEKVQLLQENLSTLEKELELRNTLNDACKQEKLDLKQQLAETKSEKDKITSQLGQIQKNFNERTTTLLQESFRNKRLIEDLESLKKKYERASKMQSASAPDEVLMEEIREYKEQLTCPSCKTKPKDAVITKCFHVFCFDCLKTRVDTRQRKCPKCNAQFGANDFHRLYLA